MKSVKKVSVYLVPLLLILLTTLIKVNMTEVLGNRTPFLLYTTVVIFATWYSGWLIGLITNFVCILLIIYLFLEPIYSFSFAPRLWVHILIFASQNIFLSMMGYALKKSLKKSREAESKLKLLLEEACDLLVLRDKSGKATYVSPRVFEMTGYTPEEYIKLGFDKLVEPEYLEMFTGKLNLLLKSPNAHDVIRAAFKRKDGQVIWLEGDVYNYLERPGINALVSHIKNVTVRVKLERQKDEFIGIASHELKTPITNIQGFTKLAKSTLYDKPEKAKAFLDRSENNIQRLSRLVNDLLDISKINTGKQTYHFETFDLSNLMEETVQSFALTHPEHRFELINEPNALLKGDRFRLEQVIINLIDNAIKYSPASRDIVISQQIANGRSVVSVQDFGIGISEEHLQAVFDRFYRVDSSAMKFQGLGLGLFIASDILKQHGGNLWAESKLGEGSRFSFIVPLASLAAANADTDGSSYFKNDSISVSYNALQNWLEVRWLGYQTRETVETSGLIILDFVKKTQSKYVLNDNSLVKGNWSDSSDHGGNIWFPMMAAAGVKYFAWVLSEDKFSNMAAYKSSEMNKSDVLVRFFKEEAEAASWLEEVKSELEKRSA
ncbi:ATP-binding protein [Pedobacter sp. SYSU D00535]|uniref:ATP-binding protein n=1 Tax=Pedobacter sp. SYSU D00535 TaxID=2810308 RepID=UPI001A967E22|nr:ATP-binding protein [Pedobacter sp. SYSU D00535]